MSVQYLSKAFDMQGLRSPVKLVLLCLADRADQDGRCWPSYDDLKRRSGLTRNAISKALAELEEKGVIERQRRYSSSTVYRITVSSTENDTISSTENDTISSTESRTLTVIEPSIEPSLLSFEEFYRAYPKKQGKVAAEKKWKTFGEETRQAAYRDCKIRYKNTEAKYIPMCSTYLNQHRWEDDLPTTATQSSNWKEFM